MRRIVRDPERAVRRHRRARIHDGGFTLVEVTVAIAIVGVTAVGILGAIIGGIGGSDQHRDHSTAMAWLQSAGDYLETVPMEVCNGTSDVRALIETDVRANVDDSDDWNPDRLSVTSVQFWNGSTFGATCYDSLQLISMTVTSPSGMVTERLTIVKSNPDVEMETPPAAADPFASCTYSALTLTSSKSGAVTAGTPNLIALKKPSLTKTSALKDGEIRVSLTTIGGCAGKLRIRYTYPHKDHFHVRTIRLTQLKGQPNVYVGKIGHGGDKYYKNATLDWTIQQGRARSKTWGTITGGQLDDVVQFA